jgi:hypothetical protein
VDLAACGEEGEVVCWGMGEIDVVEGVGGSADAVGVIAEGVFPDLVAEFAGEEEERGGNGVEGCTGWCVSWSYRLVDEEMDIGFGIGESFASAMVR